MKKLSFATAVACAALVAGTAPSAFAGSAGEGELYGYTSDLTGTAVVGSSITSVAVAQTAGLIGGRIGQFAQGSGGKGAVQGRLGSANNPFTGGSSRGVAARRGMLNWDSRADSGASGGDRDNAFDFAQRGRAGASDRELAFGAWGAFTFSSFGDNNQVSDSDGLLYSGMFGADYNTGRFLFGAAVNFEWLDMDTDFNEGEVSHLGVGINPYAAVRITDWLSVDGALGYFRFSGDNNRTNPANLGTTGTPKKAIKGDFNGDRYYATLNTTGTYSPMRNFTLTGSAGVLWAQNFVGEYVENDAVEGSVSDQTVDTSITNLGQASVSMRPSYLFYLYKLDARPTFLEPFINLTYSYDFVQSKVSSGNNPNVENHPNDKGALTLGAGFDFWSGQTFSANFEASHMFLKEEQRNTTLGGSVRVNF